MEENVPLKNDEILNEFNGVDAKEIEYPVHNQNIPCLIHDFCAENKCRLGTRLLHDICLHQAHKFDSPGKFNYCAPEQSQHVKIIV